jgi:thiol-disulfide isomerase/thioredoxin
MFNRTNLLIVVVAIVGAALGLLAGRNFELPPERPVPNGIVVLKPGDMRPDLAFPGTDGKQHRLSEWNGKVVLLNFWASWCNPCREEMPLLDRESAKTGIEVVGVAVDDPKAVKDFLRETPVSFPILLADEKNNPSIQFGDTREVFPYSVLIGRDGRIVAQKMGGFEPATLTDWLTTNVPRTH